MAKNEQPIWLCITNNNIFLPAQVIISPSVIINIQITKCLNAHLYRNINKGLRTYDSIVENGVQNVEHLLQSYHFLNKHIKNFTKKLNCGFFIGA